jgi:DNA-binding SARP family transcriptional activator
VRLAGLRESAGDPIGACQAWRSVVALDPVREDAHRGLMRLLSGLGQRDAALAQFRQCVDFLQRGLGLQPSPETVAMYRQVASV